MRLKGKTALISGAARNNPRTIALNFAREGADLILIDKVGDELKQVAQECAELGVQALPVVADIGDYEQVNRGVQAGLDRFGKVDVLVSGTGMRPLKPIWEYSYDEWHQVFAVNLHSTFYLTKVLVPGMIERKSGNIIALGALAGLTAMKHAGTLVASKHGLYGLIKSLALDLGPYGIRANFLALALIDAKRYNPEWYAVKYADMGGDPNTTARVASVPLRRTGNQQEVANVALFLASDESSYITGDRIVCAGGDYM